MKFHYFPSPPETNTLSTERLREAFQIGDLFRPGELVLHYTDLDRMIVGAVMPGKDPVPLKPDKATGTDYFLERRELGIVNIGSEGSVKVGATTYPLGNLDCLYIGKEERDVSFVGKESTGTAFFLTSTPAHQKYPTALVKKSDATADPIGDPSAANRRRINKYIHPAGIKSCQLVMGCTEFEPGSVWNTMPPHTHSRRSEAYLYFDLKDQMVVHLMGEPARTRHLIVRDRELVMSPSWSIHSGVGTGAYRFIWAMGGDNQVFSDMDAVPISQLF